jgi:hypothetical protein
MTASAATFAQPGLGQDAARLRILDAVRELAKAPFTVQDVVAKSGLPPYEVESGLAKVVRDYRSDIDVDDQGNLVYRFDPAMAARPDIVKADAARRRKEAFKHALIAFFKAWTVAMVIVYFVIYLVLLIAFLVALASANKDRDSGSSSRSRSWGTGGGGWWWFWGSHTSYGGSSAWTSGRDRRRYNREVEADLRSGKDPYRFDKAEAMPKPGLAERTWFHLFGTAGIKRNPLEAEKELLTYIRAKRGFITNADIVALLGVTYDEADAIGTRLVATYEGELDLTDDAIAIYRFPNLMLTGAPEVAAQSAKLGYLWHVRQKEENLRRNPAKIVPWLNVFNILLGILTWGAILPTLEMDTLAAKITLVFFPLTFSLIFLGLGIRRKMHDLATAAERRREAIRIAVFQLLFTRKTAVRVPGDERALASFGLGTFEVTELKAALPAIANDVRGEISGGMGGPTELRAPRIWDELGAVQKLRASARSNERVGRTVFTTRDVAGASPIGDVPAAGAPGAGPGATGDALDREIAELEKELQS